MPPFPDPPNNKNKEDPNLPQLFPFPHGNQQIFANPRNAAAGTLKQQQSQVVAKRGLDCTLYELAGNKLPFESHAESLEAARRWGFKVSDCSRLCHSLAEINEYITHWDSARKQMPFATDGIVIKVLSFLPFSSYSAMFARIAMGSVSSWEVIVSGVILIVSIIGAGWLGALIYRMGTLRYGNPIKFTKILKELTNILTFTAVK